MKIYFRNLNGLRFLAALLVVLHHSYLINRSLVINNLLISFFNNIGKLAVVFFFVLSGFLITFLLLREKEQTDTISISRFYKRRVFRIWPVYYVVVVFAYFIHPTLYLFRIPEFTGDFLAQRDLSMLFLFLFFLPNIAYAKNISLPYADQCWSIGVEEQFYAFWPWIIKFFKHTKTILFLILIFSVVCKISLFLINMVYPIGEIYFFFTTFCLSSLSIGGILAYFVFSQPKLLCHPQINKKNQLVFLGLVCMFLFFSVNFSLFTYDVYSVLFAGIILIAIQENSILNFENKLVRYFGTISYGIYMYHFIALEISRKFFSKLQIDSFGLSFCLSVTITIALSIISYELIEKRFLKNNVGRL